MRKALFFASALALAALPVIGVYLHLSRDLERRFEGTLFSVPSRVYSRPFTLQRGQDIDHIELIDRLGALGYRPAGQKEPEAGEYARGRGSLAIQRQAFGSLEAQRIVLRLAKSGRILRITAGDERRRSVQLEPEQIGEIHGSSHISRRLRALDDLPPQLIEAVIELEDRHFYEHRGLDVRRMFGALLANLRAGRIVQGGSTITQQLVKNFFLEPDRTLSRKLQEIAMATILELHHDKQEILQAYLNEIYLGQRGSVAVHGVGEGAWHYFGKTPDQLSLSEAAMLAGAIAAPGRFSPFQDLEAATGRRNLVLGLLHGRGKIDAAQYAAALDEEVELSRFVRDEAPAPYFVEHLRRQLPETITSHALEREGLSVQSTLDPQLQRFARRAVRKGLERLETQIPSLLREEAPLQAALVALDPKTGQVIAYVGGRSYGQSQFDRVSQAKRQPGSIFKPVVALAALRKHPDDEKPYTLATQLIDEEFEFDTGVADEDLWKPSNFDNEFRGPVTLRESLQHSINVPMARLGIEIGPRRVISTARRLGIRSTLRPVASIALGTNEVTLLEMTRAYGVLAAGGISRTRTEFSEVTDAEGVVLAESSGSSTRVFQPESVYLITSALMGVVEHGTGVGLRSLGVNVPIAGKTGTTNDFRDAWFIGYTPHLVAGVWVGFDDGTSIHLTGSRAALPIFGEFVRAALTTRPRSDFETPSGIEVARVNPDSGLRAGPFCDGEDEVFRAGTAPEAVCLPPVAAAPAAVGKAAAIVAIEATRPLRWLLERIFRGELKRQR